MTTGQRAIRMLLFTLATTLVAVSALAQQVTGVLGSPERHDDDQRQAAPARPTRNSAA